MSEEKQIDDGGNAYRLPITTDFQGNCVSAGLESQGMSLRDFYAAKAMQAMLSNHHMYDCINDNGVKLLAMDSFIVADAMLKARSHS